MTVVCDVPFRWRSPHLTDMKLYSNMVAKKLYGPIASLGPMDKQSAPVKEYQYIGAVPEPYSRHLPDSIESAHVTSQTDKLYSNGGAFFNAFITVQFGILRGSGIGIEGHVRW